jgi:hypothetical protein
MFAQEGFSSIAPTTVLPFANRGTGDFTSKPRDLGVAGLPGDILLAVKESTELTDSLLLKLARENIECIELTSVLDELPGSLFIAGRIGVEGLTGRGTRLARRWKLVTAVSIPIFRGWFPMPL